jgi:hypothetical protein
MRKSCVASPNVDRLTDKQVGDGEQLLAIWMEIAFARRARGIRSAQIKPGFRSRKVSEGQTWNSEDIRLYSFTVFFGPWQAVLMKASYISEAPMCAAA